MFRNLRRPYQIIYVSRSEHGALSHKRNHRLPASRQNMAWLNIRRPIQNLHQFCNRQFSVPFLVKVVLFCNLIHICRNVFHRCKFIQLNMLPVGGMALQCTRTSASTVVTSPVDAYHIENGAFFGLLFSQHITHLSTNVPLMKL